MRASKISSRMFSWSPVPSIADGSQRAACRWHPGNLPLLAMLLSTRSDMPILWLCTDVPTDPDCEQFDDEEQPLLEPVLGEPEGQLDWLLERGDWAEVPFKLRFKVNFEEFKRVVKLADSRWPAGRHSYFGRLWMYFCYNQDDGEGVNYSFFPPLGSHNRAERMVHFCIWLVLIKHSGAIWQLVGTSVSHSRFRKIDTVLRRLAEAQFLDCKRPE